MKIAEKIKPEVSSKSGYDILIFFPAGHTSALSD
jgi:hypothetical protein